MACRSSSTSHRGKAGPLGDTLARDADFFEIFGDFAGYVEFFHLQDLVDEPLSTVEFFTSFEDFDASAPLPGSLDAYLAYRERAIAFIEARNRRIAACHTNDISL